MRKASARRAWDELIAIENSHPILTGTPGLGNAVAHGDAKAVNQASGRAKIVGGGIRIRKYPETTGIGKRATTVEVCHFGGDLKAAPVGALEKIENDVLPISTIELAKVKATNGPDALPASLKSHG
jgi:hypothetical protein